MAKNAARNNSLIEWRLVVEGGNKKPGRGQGGDCRCSRPMITYQQPEAPRSQWLQFPTPFHEGRNSAKVGDLAPASRNASGYSCGAAPDLCHSQ